MRCAVSLSGDARPAVRVSGTAPAWRPSHLHLGHLYSVHCALWRVECRAHGDGRRLVLSLET